MVVSYRWDYLSIFDGVNQNAPKVTAYCGSRSVRPTDMVISSTNELFLLFESDAAVTGNGFTINFASGPCPSNCTITTAANLLCVPEYCSCLNNGVGYPICTALAPFAPTPRAGHTANYDPVTDSLFVFGGHAGDNIYLDDLRIYYFGFGVWVNVQLDQPTPLPSVRHATAFGDSVLFLYGGQIPGGQVSDQFWVFSLEVGWIPMNNTGILTPPALYGHTLTFDSDDQRLYLLGGFSNTAGFNGGLYEYDLFLSSWRKIPAQTLSPSPIFGHTAVYHSPTRSIYVHGGFRDTGQGLFVGQDVLVYQISLEQWANPASTSLYRVHHSAFLVGNFIYYYGGFFPNPNPPSFPCYYDEIVAYDICELLLFRPRS